MAFKNAIRSQYLAGLAMLKETIDKCPDELWDEPSAVNRFWHVAYHVLFYTHLYLSPTLDEFRPWEHHRDGYQYLGPLPDTDAVYSRAVYSRAEVLRYHGFVDERVHPAVEGLDLAGPSGFHWLPFDKMELQFYNIRHLQHHTGELSDRLGSRAGIELAWVGTIRAAAG